MVSTSNDSIMTEYLVKYGAIRLSAKDRPSELLETLYMTDCYRAGKDLKAARNEYDTAIWNDVPPSQINARLDELSQFMSALARDRANIWNVQL